MAGQVKQESEVPNFADRLRTRMFERGVGLMKLARSTGIDQRQLVKYRNGEHEPRDYYGRPTRNAQILAAELDVAVDWLVPPPDHSNDPAPTAA